MRNDIAVYSYDETYIRAQTGLISAVVYLRPMPPDEGADVDCQVYLLTIFNYKYPKYLQNFYTFANIYQVLMSY